MILHSSEQDNLNKRIDLAKDQPDVNHLDVRGGGKALHLAHEDGGHHQHHLKAAPKKKGLKKVVAKVIAFKRSVGKYVVINFVSFFSKRWSF